MEDRTPIGVAADIAQESKMEKRLGCVIVYKKHVIASSANRVVGTPRLYARPCSQKEIYNVSMHSEMAAMEDMLKKHGLLQLAHSLLSSSSIPLASTTSCRRFYTSKTRFRRGKKRFEKGGRLVRD